METSSGIPDGTYKATFVQYRDGKAFFMNVTSAKEGRAESPGESSQTYFVNDPHESFKRKSPSLAVRLTVCSGLITSYSQKARESVASVVCGALLIPPC